MSDIQLESRPGWECVHLKDVAEIASGVAKGRRFNGAMTVTVPYLRVANVQSGHLDLSEIKEIEVLPTDVEKCRLRPGDVLMTEGGDRDKLGRGTIWQGEVETCIHQNHVFRVRPNRTRLLPEYLNLYLGTPEAKSFFLRAAKQTTGIASINMTQLSAFPVPLPSVKEQLRIATILDKANAIRRKREEGVRLSEELLRSTFLEMFGDPVANPKGWDVDKLGNVITFVGGSQPPKDTFRSEPQDGYIRLVQIRDFKTEKYQTFIPMALARRSFATDDVMIARYGPPVFQILRGLSGSYNVALMKARPTERTTKDFIFHLLQTPTIHDTVVENSSRTAGQSGVNLELLNNLEIPIPPVSVQDSIGRSMRRIEQIKLLRQKTLRESEGLFGCLVQRAFRGEL